MATGQLAHLPGLLDRAWIGGRLCLLTGAQGRVHNAAHNVARSGVVMAKGVMAPRSLDLPGPYTTRKCSQPGFSAVVFCF